MIPLSPSLDTIGVIAASVALCIETDLVVADEPLALRPAPALADTRLGVLQGHVMTNLEAEVAEAYAQALATLRAAGAALVDIELADLDQCSRQGVGARIVGYEAFSYHRAHLATSRALFDPRVLHRIECGADIGDNAYRAALAARSAVIERSASSLNGLDGWLMPTVPITAPPIAALGDDDEFFRINGLPLRNSAMVNFVDGCAISLPCPILPGRLPVGITLAGLAGRDAEVLATALTLERLLRGTGEPGRSRRARLTRIRCLTMG